MTKTKDRLYAVSLINFFDNDLRTVFVTTPGDEMEAFRIGLVELAGDPASDSELTAEEQEKIKADIIGAYADCVTLEDAKDLSFNMDSMINVRRFLRSEAVNSK